MTVIVVAGATGRLGSRVVRLLEDRGHEVRPLSRSTTGDLRQVSGADLAGAEVVVSAVTGFPDQPPAKVDRDGNRALVDAAAESGLDVVLVSVDGASPDSPMELYRMKYAAEEHLRSSGVRSTIIRPGGFVETWWEILEKTAGRSDRPLVFGRGDNPFWWVSVDDVAAAVAGAATDPDVRGEVLTVRGPDCYPLEELARRVMSTHGWPGEPRHVPRVALHLMGALPGRPGRMARASLAMDVVGTPTG